MHLTEAQTPAAVVDLDLLCRNCEEMLSLAARHGVRLRPHVKTHKCVDAALLQCAGVGPVTVSTLAEARKLRSAGFDDVLWAVPCPHPRIVEAVDLVADGFRLAVLADQVETVANLASVAVSRGVVVSVWLKVDSGGGRAGVAPDGREGAAIGRAIGDAAGLELAGLLTHAGQAYGCRTRDEAARVARAECDALLEVAATLREHGIDPGVLSVGSTPTVRAWDAAFQPPGRAGVDEIRPGNYVFFDAFQTTIGSCAPHDVAFTVLASVIGVYPQRRTAVLDAGALALSADPGPIHADPSCGYGRLLDVGGAPLPGLTLCRLSQEHGVVHAEEAAACDQLRVGQRVRIMPNHSCLAAALHARYLVVQGEHLVGEWFPVRGW